VRLTTLQGPVRVPSALLSRSGSCRYRVTDEGAGTPSSDGHPACTAQAEREPRALSLGIPTDELRDYLLLLLAAPGSCLALLRCCCTTGISATIADFTEAFASGFEL
jgi:hypothetical protein